MKPNFLNYKKYLKKSTLQELKPLKYLLAVRDNDPTQESRVSDPVQNIEKSLVNKFRLILFFFLTN